MTEPREMTMGELERCLEYVRSGSGTRTADALRSHIAALEARAERVRDSALEEAAQRVEALNDGWLAGPCSVAVARNCFADGVRRLKSQPARQFVEAEKVLADEEEQAEALPLGATRKWDGFTVSDYNFRMGRIRWARRVLGLPPNKVSP